MLWTPALSPAQSPCWCQWPKANPTCITPLPARKVHTLGHFDDRGNLVIVEAAPTSQEGSCIFLKGERICGVFKLPNEARASAGASQLLSPDSLLFLLFRSWDKKLPFNIMQWLWLWCMFAAFSRASQQLFEKGRRATVYNIPTFTQRKRIECRAPS